MRIIAGRSRSFSSITERRYLLCVAACGWRNLLSPRSRKSRSSKSPLCRRQSAGPGVSARRDLVPDLVPTRVVSGFDRGQAGEPFGVGDVALSTMSVLPRKALLAIAAVVEVALQGHERPIAAKSLASRHGLPPRHLETVLQALVREGILRGIRGPRGGYQLARKRQHVSAGDIWRAPGAVETRAREPTSDLMVKVVLPALSAAESEFEQALGRISLDEMAQLAESGNANETAKKLA